MLKVAEISLLGALARFPYELRLTIWEYIFYLESHRPLRKEQLGILRANQAIHDEVTSSFRYDTIEVHITPVFHEGVFIYPRRLSPLQSPVSYKEHKFAKIPFDQINVVIHLYAPDPTDPGQLLLIYRKAKKLVTSLNRVTCSVPFKQVSICYHQYNGADWHHDGDPYETLKYPGRRWLDREIVLIPFLKLEKVELIPANRRMNRAVGCGFINYARDFIMRNGQLEGNVSIYKDDSKYRTIAPMFDNTDRMTADIEFFLDTQLDYLP